LRSSCDRVCKGHNIAVSRRESSLVAATLIAGCHKWRRWHLVNIGFIGESIKPDPHPSTTVSYVCYVKK